MVPRRPTRPVDHPSELPAWLPAWVFRIEMPLWICDRSGRLIHLNSRAGSLLGVSEGVGRPCHAVVGGVDGQGQPHCRADCAVRAKALSGESLRPLTIRVRHQTDDPAWAVVIVVPLEPPDESEPWLVHCAVDLSREHEFEEYLARVAARSTGTHEVLAMLTPRENEILDLLARDVDAQAIAVRLHISYATVRNHIRHLLAKLGVHSIEQAVARHLLNRRHEG